MDYIHIKNLKKYCSIEITSEGHLERVIIQNWEKLFKFDYFARRIKINKKSIVDLIGKSKDCFYLIELKYQPVRKSDRKQLLRYIRGYKEIVAEHYKIIGLFIEYNHLTCNISISEI